MSSEKILVNASDEQLCMAVEENLFALFRAMSALPNSEIEEKARLSRHITSPTNPMYKGAWGTNLAPDEIDDAIDETIDWFKTRNAPYFFWWTGPGTIPANIGERLTSHGMIDMEVQTQELAGSIISTSAGAPGMIADLHRMNEAVLETIPAGFEMHDVQNETELQEFKQVLIDGYGIPVPMADGWVQSAHGFGLGNTPWRLVLGRLNGKPVATNILFNGAGVSGVYGIAVTPEARGKGVGAAITLQPLLDARNHDGYHHAVLFATEMGVPVYERIGFRLTEARINRYLWRSAQA